MPAALLIAGTACASAATAMTYRLPAERPVALLPGPDRDLAAGICSACHSLDYITTQPRGKGAQYWKDSVAKMVTVYGAPIEPADADRIAAYLGATYGAMPGDGQGR
ncbi:MAG: cytochrome C [Sphingobium sp.]|uniref:SorB family sulfite dehydrogenase c-type cytochrome subunit n=1 Tax=Sphingobium sp. TaxID=1912891 RepID=UPI002E1DF30D